MLGQRMGKEVIVLIRVYSPLRLRRDQLERRRLIIVVAWPTRDKGRAHASSMGGHVAQLRSLARQGYGGMDGSGQEALGRVEIYLLFAGGQRER